MFETKYYCEQCNKRIEKDEKNLHKNLGHTVSTKGDLLKNRDDKDKRHNENWIRKRDAEYQLEKKARTL